MLHLSLPNWAADVALGYFVMFRFPVAAGSGIVKRRPCLVVDRRRSYVGNQTQLANSAPYASLALASRVASGFSSDRV